MSKDKQVVIKLDVKTALDVLLVLDNSTAGYSEEFAPERVVRLKAAISQIDKELEKHIL